MTTPKYIIILLLIIPLHGTAQTVRIPAEWEKQEKVWLSWFGQERRDSTSCRVIEALQPHVPLSINVESDSMKMAAIQYMSGYNIDVSKLDFVKDAYADFYIRDYVFFVKDAAEKLQIVCFDYSSYGMYPDLLGPMTEEEGRFGKWDERLAEKMRVPAVTSDYVFEGGGIESNGKGTFLVIKEMALQRNPKKTIPEIEAELKRTLGARKIIWLANGLIEDRLFPNFGPFYKNYFGGGANMHVDELCRFTDETTVVLPYISAADKAKSPVDSINYPMLETNYEILKNATTADGKKIKIIRIPMPEIEQLKYAMVIEQSDIKRFRDFGFNAGDTIYRLPAASYCNYFISNNVVLLQKYWKPGMPETQKQKDEEVRKIFAQLFPDRQIIQIHSRTVNRGGGGLHCMTHEVPVSKK
ncbi:MAG TPA: agmatine deiminase family protein [Ferruginibacter sp.]|nr:agmatine deiminase family protein [Ferruginibacter sp.]HNA00104.1 agmatine deiminase family protein [Ferruginibacter sp.]HNJ28005.1 agmatine deiminase family protein [Ferruginibacter sp.]HNJ94750.1 agmatine deiminase family protein [Ferruginibacter sp.]HNK29698.1 agmatine deiminase family protein [Ferruginibacter sp.]